MQELALRRTGSPDLDRRGSCRARLVRLADESSHDVAALEVVVVVRAEEVGGHGRDEVAAVLLAVGVTQLDCGYLGDRVRPIGLFERAREQELLLERLRRQDRVDARRDRKSTRLNSSHVKTSYAVCC